MPIFKTVNQDFFKKWSPEMTYVLGFFAADGAMTVGKRQNYYIEFTTKDLDILREIKALISPTHKISRSHRKSGGRCYRLQIGSKRLFSDLQKLGLSPRKSTRMHLPKIPLKYFPDFLRGYFDGDGHVTTGFYPRYGRIGNKKQHRLICGFTSGSKNFLQELHDVLKKAGVEGSFSFYSGAYRLQYASKASLFLYQFMYNNATLYLARKKRKFEEYIKLLA